MIRHPPRATRTYTLSPYTSLFRSNAARCWAVQTRDMLWAAEGGKVVVTDIVEPRTEQVAKEIEAAGGTAIALKADVTVEARSEEHKSELQSLMRISYDVFCLNKKSTFTQQHLHIYTLEATH